MTEQEGQDSDKLMIVESGKRGRRGATEVVSSSEPLTFQREIIGRHVIYKSSDGSKLRSVAEARRYFKQKGHVFIESQFDFTPPPADTKKKTPLSTTTPAPATNSNSVKPARGRPKTSPKSLQPKSGSIRRKDLADDLKTIRDSLKDAEPEATGLESSPPENMSKRARGRPKRVNYPDTRVDPQSCMVNETQPAVTVEPIAGYSPPAKESGMEQESATKGGRGRPSRQRKPNQRYTDLMLETKSSRKRTRKESTDALKESWASTASPPKGLRVFNELTPAIVTSTAAGDAKKVAHQRTPMAKADLLRTNKPAPKQSAAGRSKSSAVQQRGLRIYSPTMPTASEMFGDRDVGLSPIHAGEYEAPPEFVEIQAPAETPKEDQLPRLLPSVQESSATSLLYVPQTPSSSGVVAPILHSTSRSSTTVSLSRYAELPSISTGLSARSYEMEPALSRAFDNESPDPLLTPEERRIIRPVTRGRKPNTGMAALASARRQAKRNALDEAGYGGYSSSARLPGYRFGGEASMKYDYGLQGIRVSGQATESPFRFGYNSNNGQNSGRGLAQLQRRDPKRMVIGRYGAASMAASLDALRDPPPELELYGGPTIEKKTPKPGKLDQQKRGDRHSAPTDVKLFVHLPPEVVSDHCYGRQPDITPGTGGQQKTGGIPASAAVEAHYDQSVGSPPPALVRMEQTSERRLQLHERGGLQGHNFETPSPPPYQSRFRSTSSNYTTYQGVDVSGFARDLGTGSGVSSARGGQQLEVLGDRLPANILEDDDGETIGESATSISIQ